MEPSNGRGRVDFKVKETKGSDNQCPEPAHNKGLGSLSVGLPQGTSSSWLLILEAVLKHALVSFHGRVELSAHSRA